MIGGSKKLAFGCFRRTSLRTAFGNEKRALWTIWHRIWLEKLPLRQSAWTLPKLSASMSVWSIQYLSIHRRGSRWCCAWRHAGPNKIFWICSWWTYSWSCSAPCQVFVSPPTNPSLNSLIYKSILRNLGRGLLYTVFNSVEFVQVLQWPAEWLDYIVGRSSTTQLNKLWKNERPET